MKKQYSKIAGTMSQLSEGRWMPRIIHSLLRSISGSSVNPEADTTATAEQHELSKLANVYQLPVSAGQKSLADTDKVEHDDRIYDLQLQNAVLLGDYAEWNERCLSLETNLDRSREQVESAGHRLTRVGEEIPDATTESLSVLQESYQNFEMAVTLHENKLEKARQRLSMLLEKRACVTAELLVLSPRALQPSAQNPVVRYTDTPMCDSVESVSGKDDNAIPECIPEFGPEFRRVA